MHCWVEHLNLDVVAVEWIAMNAMMMAVVRMTVRIWKEVGQVLREDPTRRKWIAGR